MRNKTAIWRIEDITNKLQLKFLIESNSNYRKEIFLKNNFPYFYQDILTWSFPDDFKFSQKLYHYLNDDPELKLGICPECGKRCCFLGIKCGYRIFCSQNCERKSILTIHKRKNSCLKKYGKEYYLQTDECREKSKQTCLNRYGCENPSQSEEFKEKKKQACLKKYGKPHYSQTDEFKDKYTQTCLEKYGCENPFQSKDIQEKRKQTCLEKYGETLFTKTYNYKKLYNDKEWVKAKQEKEYKTKKKNNSFHTSKIEEQLQQYLTENNISYIYQYTSDLYPFNCDFYFPDKDLYVEIQGTWSHGGKPFTGSVDDLKQVEIWKSKNTKYYNYAIETWTVRDVRKREIAKKNNLNYVELFSCNLDYCINYLSSFFINGLSKSDLACSFISSQSAINDFI